MSLTIALPWLIAALVASVVGMAIGGMTGRLGIVVASAGFFGACAIALSVSINAPLWREGRLVLDSRDDAIIALRRNSNLVAIAYVWGASAMQTLYTTSLTGLRWQHGWQYALAMLLFAVAAFRFARGLSDPKRQDGLVALGAPVAIFNALLGAAGLAFLAMSGKLLLWRSDWAANQVFLFGALVIMVLSAIGLKTHARLMRE